MILYKLTTQDNKTKLYTQYETLWGENITNTITIHGNRLCSNQVIHAYRSPELAILMNPIHAGIKNPKLWEAEGEIIAEDSTKVGVKSLTTIREIPLPKISLNNIVAFGILAVKCIYYEPSWNKWADDWLQNKNRSNRAAAYDAASDAASDAAYTATDAAYAAGAAANASITAGDAASDAAYAASAAAYAVSAYAASAATDAAYATDANNKLNLVEIAKKALTYD